MQKILNLLEKNQLDGWELKLAIGLIDSKRENILENGAIWEVLSQLQEREEIIK